MAVVEVVSGLDAGESHRLVQPETIVGRHPQCQIVLRDPTVSRRHARIVQDQNGYYVDDLGSQHGTRVNQELVRAPCRLKDRDELMLSRTKLTFLDDVDQRRSARDSESSSAIVASVDVLDDSDVPEATAPKWRALLEITRTLGASLDLSKILPNVLENTFRILPKATRGCIAVVDRRSGELVPLAVKDTLTQTATGPPPISRAIGDSVMSEAKAVLIRDVAEDQRFEPSDSALEFKMHSVLCAPLIGAADAPLGMIHLDARDASEEFTPADLEILVNIANLVGQAVDHVQLHETQLEFERRERNLATARQLQLHFLPQTRPSLPDYRLFDYYSPAEAVGGDYFGYVWLPDGKLAVAVGDVAGHGIPAALLMARLCAEARYCLVTNSTPSEAIQALNRELSKSNLDFFITFALCVLDPQRHQLTVVNAGHAPAVLRRAGTGKTERIGSDLSGPPLGIQAKMTYDQCTTQLEPGDLVLMYTDGLNEAPRADAQRYGNDRIFQVLAGGGNAQQVVEALLSDLEKFTGGRPQVDDICIVALSRDEV